VVGVRTDYLGDLCGARGRGGRPNTDVGPSATNVGPLAFRAAVTRPSHWRHRAPDIVWSHVRCASDVYGEPQSVLIGLGAVSATACHSGQWLRRRSDAHNERRGISGTARYLMEWTPLPPALNSNRKGRRRSVGVGFSSGGIQADGGPTDGANPRGVPQYALPSTPTRPSVKEHGGLADDHRGWP